MATPIGVSQNMESPLPGSGHNTSKGLDSAKIEEYYGPPWGRFSGILGSQNIAHMERQLIGDAHLVMSDGPLSSV